MFLVKIVPRKNPKKKFTKTKKNQIIKKTLFKTLEDNTINLGSSRSQKRFNENTNQIIYTIFIMMEKDLIQI